MLELDPALLAAAWLAGLAGGSGHCFAMCGGIVGALALRQRAGLTGMVTLAAAHLGRILAYASVGGVAGALGAALGSGLLGAHGGMALRVLAAVLIALVGLQLLLGRALLRPLEQGGARVWQHLAPLARRLLPPRGPLSALAAGALWGFLPCGLVYSALAVAAASGSALEGAALMAAFGLGTLLSLGAVAAVLHAVGISRLPRRASGALLIVLGIWSAALPLLGMHAKLDQPTATASSSEPSAGGHRH